MVDCVSVTEPLSLTSKTLSIANLAPKVWVSDKVFCVVSLTEWVSVFCVVVRKVTVEFNRAVEERLSRFVTSAVIGSPECQVLAALLIDDHRRPEIRIVFHEFPQFVVGAPVVFVLNDRRVLVIRAVSRDIHFLLPVRELVETTPIVALLLAPDKFGVSHTLARHGYGPTLRGAGAQTAIKEWIAQEEPASCRIFLADPKLSRIYRVMIQMQTVVAIALYC
jgi:hypothetical protein